ncbi:MAG TPA: ATP-binding cassette domain-containing protein [Mycobacteriales bacterium]|jgi:signal transduction histidine kinase/ABC-type multidrug transport system ATPase subunit|nr:ATP-binding cassette domain-containing protein [Mycobacteriales bacterium]
MLARHGLDPKEQAIAPLLSVRGLAANYGARRALTGVDLDIQPGEVLALAGENGAGKSTLVRCIAGDLPVAAGEIFLDGERIRVGPKAVSRRGVAVVWQDLSLCDNLDVASNLLLGREPRRILASDARFHAAAAELLSGLGIPVPDTTRPVASLSGGQRQLIAVARAMRDAPRLLILDEPTASLGVIESGQVESLTRRLCDDGTTILLVSHDIEQMFRLADRIIVLRQGRVVADVPTASGHPDEIVALMSGQPVDSSPRRQLDRLHSLVGQLTSADRSSSLAVILSALGTALAADRLCIHLVDSDRLRLTASVGLPADLLTAWAELPSLPSGGPAGAAASSKSTVIDNDVRTAPTWTAYRKIAERANIRSSWAVPVTGSAGLVGVITVIRRSRGTPHRDELDLVTLYAGYAASTAERDGLLGEVTARNRVLETIRVVLEQLAVSVPLAAGLDIAVDTLRLGLGADEVALLGWLPDEEPRCRGWSSAAGGTMRATSPLVRALQTAHQRSAEQPVISVETGGAQVLAAQVPAPDGPLTLLAAWPAHSSAAVSGPGDDAAALLEDAARSLQLALERESSERAHREAAGLRRSQELQRDFLSRLSHELRTPLTAIHGYADSLLQTDVTWDADSQERFLSRITTESARLSRLVGDLLDLSAIESNILRLHRDWCDIALIVDAARACLPLDTIGRVQVTCDPLPAVWADHDRLEQVLVNLMDNAVRHNPSGTEITVSAKAADGHAVTITVADNGIGLPRSFDGHDTPRSATAGAGLGLSISRAIVAAHGGTLRLEQPQRGTRWHIDLPYAGADAENEPSPLVTTDG